eukprot:418692-Pelagomonas_calceolata.AAC.4
MGDRHTHTHTHTHRRHLTPLDAFRPTASPQTPDAAPHKLLRLSSKTQQSVLAPTVTPTSPGQEKEQAQRLTPDS